MKAESFCSMLEHVTATRLESHSWMVSIYRTKYGKKPLPVENIEPLPPTLLFLLELRTLEAARFVKDTDTVAV